MKFTVHCSLSLCLCLSVSVSLSLSLSLTLCLSVSLSLCLCLSLSSGLVFHANIFTNLYFVCFILLLILKWQWYKLNNCFGDEKRLVFTTHTSSNEQKTAAGEGDYPSYDIQGLGCDVLGQSHEPQNE